MDAFDDQALPPEAQEAWQALEQVPGTTVSDRFEARLMARIETIEADEKRASSNDRLQRWLQWLDGLFNFLHIPALAILIALLFWLPTSSPKTAHRLDFPSFESPRAMQDRESHLFEPQHILQLLIYISRS